MKLKHRATELLRSLEYLNIATVSANAHPWNTPVYARHDDRLNFYWCSWKDAEHSRNIRANPRIFVTLYDSTIESEETIICVVSTFRRGHAK